MGYNPVAKYHTLLKITLLKLKTEQLTGALDGNFKLSSAGSSGINLKVCSLLHPQALWLQTTALSSAEVGITCCGETYNERVRETETALNISTPTTTRVFSGGFSWETRNEVQGERY